MSITKVGTTVGECPRLMVEGAMSKQVVIVKLGGSSITDKTGYEALKPQGLSAAADLIQRAYEAKMGVVVVHGAGSFGHPQAKKYGINKGWAGLVGDERDTAVFGFAATRASVLKLSGLIVQELVNRGLPATPLPPCGVWHTDNGLVTKSNVCVVGELLGLGFIPVLHGDGVLDNTKGCSILSGDIVIRTLAKELSPPVTRVVFLTDVAGVYDKAPDLPGAQLLSRIEVDDSGELVCGVSTQAGASKGDDVTGGMKLKLATAIHVVVDSAGAVPVFICDVGGEAATSACLEGTVGERATVLCKQHT